MALRLSGRSRQAYWPLPDTRSVPHMARTGNPSRWSSTNRNLIPALPRKC